jgi:multicomponent Na+:H+ antiporter subunit D
MNLLVNNIIPSQVIILLTACCVLPIISRRGWLISFVAIYLCAFISCLLVLIVKKYGVLSYVFGGFFVPQGIEYRFDDLSASFALLVTVGLLPVFIYCFLGVKLEIERHKRAVFYSLMLVNVAGALGIVISHDLFNIYVFIEIMSLSAYGLVSAGKSKGASFHALNYLILGTIGATFYLMGLGMIYSLTGSLNISDIARLMSNMPKNNLIILSYIFIILGILLKIGIFPFQNWLTNIYHSAPSPVVAMFSISSGNVMFYLLIRFIYDVMNHNLINYEVIKQFLTLLAALTIIVGGFMALFQKEFKKLLAYSTISNYGMILFAIILGTKESLAAALVLIASHAIAKSALFMSSGLMSLRRPSLMLENMPGTFAKAPWTTTSFVINMLVVAGLPPFLSFFGKWQLLVSSFNENKLYIFVVIIGSILSLLYSLIIIDKVLFKPEQPSGLLANTSQILMELSIVLSGIYIVVMTIFTGFLFQQAQIIATFILKTP